MRSVTSQINEYDDDDDDDDLNRVLGWSPDGGLGALPPEADNRL